MLGGAQPPRGPQSRKDKACARLHMPSHLRQNQGGLPTTEQQTVTQGALLSGSSRFRHSVARARGIHFPFLGGLFKCPQQTESSLALEESALPPFLTQCSPGGKSYVSFITLRLLEPLQAAHTRVLR